MSAIEPAVAQDVTARDDAEPWYAGGLRFACTQCGRCCTGSPGYVWTDPSEITALARKLDMSLDDFGRRYLRAVGARYALLENSVTGDCVFYRDGACTVYDARPRQCRAFPFWPEHLRSRESWAAAARECEGIRDDAPRVERERIQALRRGDDDAPLVAREHVRVGQRGNDEAPAEPMRRGCDL